MAWDTDGTRRRIQEAACAEFTAFGPDGTTVERIASRARINKERLYSYFGSKRQLFEAVLTDELEKLASSLSTEALDLDQIGEYVGCIFDYHVDHPQLVRLLLWESLGGGPAVNENARSAHYRRTVAMFASAQQKGILRDDVDPAKLLFMLIGLALWWFAVPQLSAMITGESSSNVTERDARRASVVDAAWLLATLRPCK